MSFLTLVDDLYVEQFASFAEIYTAVDEYDAPIDVSDWSFEGQIRDTASAKKVLAELTFSFVTDGTDGQVRYSLTGTQTGQIRVKDSPTALREITEHSYDM